jgi:ubiquinone/menaquinone biosynthesis C-methylase UbiE
MDNKNTDKEWHLRLFQKSLLKRAKWRQIERMMPPMNGDATGLDIGADNGVISLLLRKRGGVWSSVDSDPLAVNSIRCLVGDNVALMGNGKLPFGDESFNVVVIIDMLEHLEDDGAFIKECHRVLKPAGRLIINVPHIKKYTLLRPLRNLVGLTDKEHGHVRSGYTKNQLFHVIKDGFDVEESTTYSRFFVEFLDIFIRLAAKKSGGTDERSSSKGLVIDESRFEKMQKLFRVYSVLFPFFWIASQLDHLLFFTKGHSLIAKSRRRLWIPRKTPVLRDGRSIADATLNTKIGTASPF